MSDLISIIVPIYNASKYLEQCIESVLAQTYKNLDIILVNDGSTDDSAQICKKYQETDGRIQNISQENRGPVAARKAGLKKARGAYIGFVDSDDYIEPEMFEMLHKKIKETGADIVHSGMILEDRKICGYPEELIDFTQQKRYIYINENVFMKQTLSFSLWSKLFKADLIINAYMLLPDEQSYGEDLLCLCEYISRCDRIYMFKDAFYHYRVREGSLSHLKWLDTCIEESKLHSHVLDILKKNGLLKECGGSARYHYKRRVLGAMTSDPSSGVRALRYRLDDVDILKGKKIVLYGAGKVGMDVYFQLSQLDQCEVVAWADKEKHGTLGLLSICQPEALKEIQYDVILLAVKDKEVADVIKDELKRNDICQDDQDFLWKEPLCLW